MAQVAIEAITRVRVKQAHDRARTLGGLADLADHLDPAMNVRLIEQTGFRQRMVDLDLEEIPDLGSRCTSWMKSVGHVKTCFNR